MVMAKMTLGTSISQVHYLAAQSLYLIDGVNLYGNPIPITINGMEQIMKENHYRMEITFTP